MFKEALLDGIVIIELGVIPLSIREQLEHDNIKTTLNTYSHLYPNKQSEIAKILTEYVVCYQKGHNAVHYKKEMPESPVFPRLSGIVYFIPT